MTYSIPGPLSVRECDVLAALASSTKASRALEVGNYLGLSTSVLLQSLPDRCELVTVDHHQGDEWCPATSPDEFMDNVGPFVGDRSFRFVNDDMRSALTDVGWGFGFVFYDADHTASAVAEFWDHAAGLLDERCTLVFDDADWAEQSTLRGLAEADGFTVVTSEPFWRGDGDKHDPETYTLEVMQRD